MQARATTYKRGWGVVVNYDRSTLRQEGFGHISPLGAHHAGSDRVLVLDVAAHRYPPVWVRTSDLYRAMRCVDPVTGRSRGWVEISAGQ